jgi:hypothetical protein
MWEKQCPGRCYGALNRRLPWQLQQQFKIKLKNDVRAFVEYWLALALTIIPENSGNLEPISQFVQLRKSLVADALKVFRVGNIVACTHVIAKIATNSQTQDEQNKRWIIYSPIDLGTWNDVYHYYRENSISRAT